MATRADERLVGPFSALWYLIFVLPLFLFTPDRPGTRAPAPVKAGHHAAHQRREGALPAPPAGRALPHCPHALRRRARRGVRLWRHLRRERVRLGGLRARPVRHHPYPRRHHRRCLRRRARRSPRLEARDRLGAVPVHSRVNRRALRRQDARAVRASGRAEGAGQRTVLVRRASRSISPSPFSSASPRARSRRRAARCSQG